jgi:hypothetical protein
MLTLMRISIHNSFIAAQRSICQYNQIKYDIVFIVQDNQDNIAQAAFDYVRVDFEAAIH